MWTVLDCTYNSSFGIQDCNCKESRSVPFPFLSLKFVVSGLDKNKWWAHDHKLDYSPISKCVHQNSSSPVYFKGVENDLWAGFRHSSTSHPAWAVQEKITASNTSPRSPSSQLKRSSKKQATIFLTSVWKLKEDIVGESCWWSTRKLSNGPDLLTRISGQPKLRLKTSPEQITDGRQHVRIQGWNKQKLTLPSLCLSLSPNTFFAFQEQALHSYLVFNFTSSKNKDGLDH